MKNLISLALLCFSITTTAQTEIKGIDYRACSTSEHYNDILRKNPIVKSLMDQQNQFAQEWTNQNYGKTSGTDKKIISYIIPVVWHVIHNDGPENLSKATIENEIAQLNLDFQKLNPDILNAYPIFAGITADSEIEFRLARLDPDGNCTEGITRTKSTLTYAMDEIVKETIRPSWNTPTVKYLNIWQGSKISFDAGGYAFYPGTTTDETEGIVLIAQQLGNTVTHEVGHYLNLAHLWGDSNDPQDPNNCFDDDHVTDTPNTIGRTGCLTNAQSCGSLDNGQNYMEYNFCDVMFTEGQKQRMHAALNSPVGARNLLCSTGNLVNTGTANPYVQTPICTPIANFTYSKTFICEGEQVSFSDKSYNATPTGWNWTFYGGTPSTSNLQNPTITYNTKGIYAVKHEPLTTNGSGLHQKDSIVIVSSINPDYSIPYSESFENLITLNDDWISMGNANRNWKNISTAAFSGSKSMVVENIYNESIQTTDLLSPTYDFSLPNNFLLTYKYAHAQKLSGGNDRLIIYYSTNCGSSWSILKVKTSSALASAPKTNNYFTPTPSQWKEESIDVSSLSGLNNVKFKFNFKNSGGNNFWIDDLNISITTGVNQLTNVINYKIYPNPTNEGAMVTFGLTNSVESLSITLKDLIGHEVTKIVGAFSFSAGQYTMSIDQGKKLAPGLYFLEFNVDGNISSEKLIVQ